MKFNRTLLIITLAIATLAPVGLASAATNLYHQDKHDPMRRASGYIRSTAACIRHYESRDHVVDGLANQGLYQFARSTWDTAAKALGISYNPNGAVWANGASIDTQDRVFLWTYAHDGWWPWLAERGLCWR